MRRILTATLLLCGAGNAQIYDILLKNGHVIDPANHRNGRFDIAIVKDKIARVAPDLPAAHGRVVIDLGQYTVAPGLIDIETHFNAAAGGRNIQPDHNALPNGVTTAVDVGDSTPKNFEQFKSTVIDHSRTRMLAFLSPSGDDAGAGAMMRRYPQIILGVKMGESSARPPLVFADASREIRAGHLPEIIATGIDRDNIMLQRANMMTTASKYLNLGMTLDQIVERTTVNPSRAIRRPDLGALNEGGVADVAVIETDTGSFGFLDAKEMRMMGTKRLRCVLTIRNGAVVWDSDGLFAEDWIHAGPYSNYK